MGDSPIYNFIEDAVSLLLLVMIISIGLGASRIVSNIEKSIRDQKIQSDRVAELRLFRPFTNADNQISAADMVNTSMLLRDKDYGVLIYNDKTGSTTPVYSKGSEILGLNFPDTDFIRHTDIVSAVKLNYYYRAELEKDDFDEVIGVKFYLTDKLIYKHNPTTNPVVPAFN